MGPENLIDSVTKAAMKNSWE